MRSCWLVLARLSHRIDARLARLPVNWTYSIAFRLPRNHHAPGQFCQLFFHSARPIYPNHVISRSGSSPNPDHNQQIRSQTEKEVLLEEIVPNHYMVHLACRGGDHRSIVFRLLSLQAVCLSGSQRLVVWRWFSVKC